MMDVKLVDVCGVPTKVITWGKKLNEIHDKKEIILCITGNPGLTGFYITFLSTLFKFLHGNIPVLVIGHAGHDEDTNISETLKVPRLKNNKHLYDLNGQINHKIEFIRKHIPLNVKIHLIGHSIGAYISLQLLKIEDIGVRIQHCYLLFPTFEYMADAPNGKLYITFIQRYFKFIYYLTKLVSLMPLWVKKILISIYFLIQSIPTEYMTTVLMMIRPSVLSKIVYMADDEMEKIKEPDYALIEKNKHRLTFFYSITDGWTPVVYYERLIERIHGVKTQITDKYNHTFMMKTSYDMGALVAEWIQQNID